MYFEGLGLGVQLLLAGGKHDVTAGRFQLGAIGLQRTRVGIKVFVRCKLQAVYKDGADGHVTQRLGLAH